MMVELQTTYGGMPFSGGLLEQPYAVLVIVAALRNYAESYVTFTANPKNASPRLRSRVLLTAAASVEN